MSRLSRKQSARALFALAALLSLAAHAEHRSMGEIRFVGSIFAPTVPVQQFVGMAARAADAPEVARVGREPIRDAMARSPSDLLDYFATYAGRQATLVTAVYP